jgi:hypothetical protein
MNEDVLDRIAADPETIWHPVLQTNRAELREACKGKEGYRTSGSELRVALTQATEEQIGQIATRLGSLMMDGADYWDAIPYAVEWVLRP